MEEKIKIIDQIVSRHPGWGTEKGWSWYIGGMSDTGDWYYRKMLDVSIEELQAFLDYIIECENQPEKVYTEQEIIDRKTFLKVGDQGFLSEYQHKLHNEFMEDFERKILFGKQD